jgi:hypothetical protein
MKWLQWRYVALALSALLAWSAQASADEAKPKAKEAASFGILESMSSDAAKAKALEWLKEVGKSDADTLKKVEAIFADAEKPVLDKVTEVLVLGDADAAKILADARDPNAPAPTEIPSVLRDPKKSTFLKANLAISYAKALTGKRVFEEALDSLKTQKVENTVDPGAFLFYKAVAEHELAPVHDQMKDDANRTILRLLDDVVDAPERYKMIAALMHFDMLTWKSEKDKDVIARLGGVGRIMGNIERRLDLSRGGPVTQEMQKRVLVNLDEMIKEEEEKQNQQGQGSGSGKGKGQQKGQSTPNNNINASRPQEDSFGGNGSGPGNVDPKKFKELAQVWGTLPEKERAKALLELTSRMPDKHRQLIQDYFKKLAQDSGNMK